MILRENKNRVYHPFWRWECHRSGFYGSASGLDKEEKLKKVVEMFNSERLTRKYMKKVLELWSYSCEHNLTNSSINKIAFVGQAACCIYANVPSTVTMEGWNLLDNFVQERANNIAIETINEFKTKPIQLCLNID